MPGVVRIDRLSLPDAAHMSKEARLHKIEEVSQLAKEARMNISRFANAVSFSSPFPIYLCSFPLSHPSLLLHYRRLNFDDVALIHPSL